MHTSPSCPMCSSAQPALGTATMTTDSAVIDRYTLTGAQEKHSAENIPKPIDWRKFAVPKSDNTSRQRHSVFSKCRTSRNFVGASAVHSARAVPSSESQRENLKNLPATSCSPTSANETSIEDGRHECVAVIALGYFLLASCKRWRSLRASVHQRGTPFLPERSSPHPPHQLADRASGIQWANTSR